MKFKIFCSILDLAGVKGLKEYTTITDKEYDYFELCNAFLTDFSGYFTAQNGFVKRYMISQIFLNN